MNRFLPLIAASALLTTAARAATFTWDGGGANDNWSTAANWNPDGAPLVATTTDDITFAGAVRLTPSLDSARTIASLTFAADAGAFTLGGANPLTLGAGGLFQNAAVLATIAHPLALGAAQTWSVGSGGLTLGGVLSGSSALVKTGAGTLTLSGATANTHSGGMTVQGGLLVLAKSPAVAALAGPLIIGGAGSAATVRIGAASQLPDSTAVTVLGGGSLELTNFAETIGTLTIDATAGAATVTSTGANLGLTSATMTGGSITVPSSFFALNFQGATGAAVTTLASAQSATIAGRIGLGGTRGFVVADGAAAVDLDVPAVLLAGGGTIDKQGPGTLRLSAANGHTGTTLTAGTLLAAHDSALGSGGFTVAGAARLEADGAARTLANATTLDAALTVGGTHDVTFTGVLGGTGGVVKTDASTLTLAGTSANTFTGTTIVQAGTLVLGKTAGVNALGGNLAIGTGATARLAAANQIADTAAVTVASGAAFDLDGNSETIGALVLDPGAAPFSTGAASLTTNSITLTGGNISGNIRLGAVNTDGITTLPSATTATVTGTIDHGNPSFDRTYSIADGAAAVDLDASGAAIIGGVIKEGAGTLKVADIPSFNFMALNAGTVALASDFDGLVRFGLGAIRADGGPRSVTLGTGTSFLNSTSTITVTGSEDITFTRDVDLSTSSIPRRLVIHGSVVAAFTGSLSGRRFDKFGTGTLELRNIGNLTEPTLLAEGTLRLTNSSGSALGDIQVNVGARIEGTGSFDGRAAFGVAGVIAPGIGAGIGRLGCGDLDMQAFGTLEIGLAGGTAGTLYDQLVVRDTNAPSSDGAVLLGGGATLSLSLLGGFDPADGAVFYIVDNDGTDAISGTFANVTGGPNPLAPGLATFFAGGQQFAVSYAANWTGDPLTSAISGGNDIALVAVPEPGSAALLAVGMCALLVRGSRCPNVKRSLPRAERAD